MDINLFQEFKRLEKNEILPFKCIEKSCKRRFRGEKSMMKHHLSHFRLSNQEKLVSIQVSFLKKNLTFTETKLMWLFFHLIFHKISCQESLKNQVVPYISIHFWIATYAISKLQQKAILLITWILNTNMKKASAVDVPKFFQTLSNWSSMNQKRILV